MLKTKAPAKLNLGLHILPRRFKNGLYPIKFINCEIDLHDELYFKLIKNKIKIIADNPQLSDEKNNLVYKAAYLLKKFTKNKELGVEITLKKNIPIRAGLGGGSSDASSTLKALIKLWQVKINDNQLFKIVGQLGKDVFYSLKGGVCEVLDDGSLVNKFKSKMSKFSLIIITPEEKKPSTDWMYKHLDCNLIGQNLKKFFNLKKAVIANDRKKILINLFNDFEMMVLNHFPTISKIKDELLKEGALRTLLAGSGLSVTGFFTDEKKAKKAFDNLKIKYKNAFYEQTK